MSLHDAVSFICAVASAFGVALANVMQRKASLDQPKDLAFGIALLGNLVRNKTWLLGIAGMVGSFVLQAVALGFGQLSTVETIVTLEVPLTMMVASRVFHSSLGRMEWTGILTLTAGIILMVLALDPRPGDAVHVEDELYVIAGGTTVFVLLGFVVASSRGGLLWRTAMRGAAAGTSFGLTATFIKRTIEEGESGGLIGVLTTWQTYAAVSFGVGGVVMVQWALHTGPLVAAQPGMTIMDPIVSIIWGVLVFKEVTNTGWWLALAVFGAMCLFLGVILLARSPLFAAVHEVDGTGEEHVSNPAAANYVG